MISSSLRVLPVLFVLSLSVTSSPSPTNVRKTIHVKEETKLGTTVASAQELLNLLPGNWRFQLLNQQLQPPSDQQRPRWFSLDASNGAIVLRHRVDRETLCPDEERCVIHLQIFVRGKPKLLDLDVIIDDVNDKSPTFPVTSIALNLSEATPIGFTVNLDRYIAHDADLGNNSKIKYNLRKNRFFQVHQFRDEMETNHLQLKIARKLDYEVESIHNLILTARDEGIPSRSSDVSLRITLNDVNDNPPVFEKQEYVEELEENLPSGYVISQVHANDVDSGPWGTVRYSISERNKALARNLVRIDEVSGDVRLRQKLDREKHDKLRIRIDARDQGPADQQLVGGTWLIINVRDVNDNKPVIGVNFIRPHDGMTVYVKENSTADTYFASLVASDQDSGVNGQVDVIILSVTASGGDVDTAGKFVLFGGLLGVTGILDREQESRYVIVVQACDRGATKQCTRETVKVVVLDVNDNPPVFDECQQEVSVVEDMRVGTMLIKVHATDADVIKMPVFAEDQKGDIVTSSNGDVTYLIAKGDGTFSIEPRTGRINLVRPLDRESNDIHKLTVVARDKGQPTSLSSSCDVTITINDANDCEPSFVNPAEESSSVYATILRDDIIMRIQAVDYDLGENAVVRYALLGAESLIDPEYAIPESSVFILDPVSGDLTLNSSYPDKEELLGEHELIIEARDQGVTQQLRSLRHLNVIVTDLEVLPTFAPSNADQAISSSHIIIIVSLASSLLLLTIIIVAVFLKCRSNRKKSRTYSCPKATNEKNWSRASVNSLKQQPLPPRRRLSEESGANKSERLWERSPSKIGNGSVVSSSSHDVTSTSRSEMISKQIHLKSQYSFRSNNSVSSKNLPEKPLPSSRTLSHDGDSGRGDSDPDFVSYDVTYEQELSKFHSTLASHRSPMRSPQPTNQLGSRCTQLCLRYGHSDTCWMPPTVDESSPFIDNKSSLYVQLRPLPSRDEFRPLTSPRNDIRLLSPRTIEDKNLQPIPESSPLRRIVYPMSDLSSIYSNVVNPHRYFPAHAYGAQHNSPLRRSSDVIPQHVTSFDGSPVTSRLSPLSAASSAQHSDCAGRRKNHCVNRRDVAPDDVTAASTVSAPASPRKVAAAVTRSNSVDHLTSPSTFSFSNPRLTNDSDTRAPSRGPMSMRETQKIVDNIEKLLQS